MANDSLGDLFVKLRFNIYLNNMVKKASPVSFKKKCVFKYYLLLTLYKIWSEISP